MNVTVHAGIDIDPNGENERTKDEGAGGVDGVKLDQAEAVHVRADVRFNSSADRLERLCNRLLCIMFA